MDKFRVRRTDYGWNVQTKEYMGWFWHTLTTHDSFKEAMNNYYILTRNNNNKEFN